MSATFTRVTHTDWWYCGSCDVTWPVITNRYQYQGFCTICKREATLIERTRDLGNPPFPGKTDE
jgi:hypothetical protein